MWLILRLRHYISNGSLTVPGTVCHLDSWALTFQPTTLGHWAITQAGPTATPADQALTVVLVAGLPWGPLTETTILRQVPHLQRGFQISFKSTWHWPKMFWSSLCMCLLLGTQWCSGSTGSCWSSPWRWCTDFACGPSHSKGPEHAGID